MAFGIADLSTIVVIKAGLERLAQNPNHLSFMLSGFTAFKEIRQLVGAQYIDQCVKLISERRIHVMPYYEADMQKLPSVVVAHKPNEGTQFIGDYGSVAESGVELPPQFVMQFDAVQISDNLLSVPASLNVEKTLWSNLWVYNSGFMSQITGIAPGSGSTPTVIALKDTITTTTLKGWVAQTAETKKMYEVHSSIDNTDIQAKLTTIGEYGNHRVMATAIRYVLKQGRMHFNDLGLQVATFGQSFPILTDGDQQTYETTFTISCKVTDSWIDHEFTPSRSSDRICEDTVATSPGEEDVPL